MYEGAICLGLTPGSTNDEKKKAAFDFVFGIGYMTFASTAADGKTPTARGLEVHRLDDEGNMYVGVSRGKHFFDEMELMPYTCGMAIDTVAVRISACLKKVDDEKLRERYWELNGGTKSMYRKDLSNFQLYRMERGEGEVFHVYKADSIARVRFSFGGEPVRPWAYTISEERCTNCGVCVEKCMMSIIESGESFAHTDHYGCNECGICYFSCPNEAISKNEFAAPKL